MKRSSQRFFQLEGSVVYGFGFSSVEEAERFENSRSCKLPRGGTQSDEMLELARKVAELEKATKDSEERESAARAENEKLNEKIAKLQSEFVEMRGLLKEAKKELQQKKVRGDVVY